jgi:hypothetical protein
MITSLKYICSVPTLADPVKCSTSFFDTGSLSQTNELHQRLLHPHGNLA